MYSNLERYGGGVQALSGFVSDDMGYVIDGLLHIMSGIMKEKSSNKLVNKAVLKGYYQDKNGEWNRPDGKFASNAEVGLPPASSGNSGGTHGNSLEYEGQIMDTSWLIKILMK